MSKPTIQGMLSQMQPTHQQADGQVYFPAAKRYTFGPADLDGSDAIAFPIPAGVTVLGVTLKVTTAFDNAADVAVGDSADADGFITAAEVDPTATLFFNSMAGAGAYKTGKHYAAADRVIVDFTATPTVGEAEVCIYFAGYME